MQIGLGLRETETATADWKWFERRLKTFSPGLTKSKQSRSIPVPPSLYPLLIEEWERQGKPASGHILKYRDGEKPVYRGFSRNAIASAGRKMGIVGLHPHRLRASWATAHREQGTEIDVIMEMAGHKYESTTRLYIVKRSKDATDAQDRVSKAMGF
jgi:integrase